MSATTSASKAKGLERINALTYSHAARNRLYTKEYWLPGEASILLDYSSDIVCQRILELGAGSGRLSAVLKHRAAEYVATDINPDMVRTLSAVHPTVRALVADARNLEGFNAEYFNTVIFSFNGIDCMPFLERPKALSEIYRVLISGGAFLHSTHNVAHAHSASHRLAFGDLCGAPIRYLRRVWNRMRLARLEHYSPDYAVVNDRALYNGLLNVYVKPELHFAQLAEAGFTIDSLYDREGRRLSKAIPPADQWYYVVARKRAEFPCE